jgi:hypothetical protein
MTPFTARLEAVLRNPRKLQRWRRQLRDQLGNDAGEKFAEKTIKNQRRIVK